MGEVDSMNLLVWVLCYAAFFINSGQCGESEESSNESSDISSSQSYKLSQYQEERSEYKQTDVERYVSACKGQSKYGENTCRPVTLEEPADDEDNQNLYGGASQNGVVPQARLDDMSEEERKIAQIKPEDLVIKEEYIWAHKPNEKAGPGCGNPICVLIDARPERFKSMCDFIHYIDDNKLRYRMFHIQKGDCYTAIQGKGHKYEWGKDESCGDYGQGSNYGKYDVPLCLVDIAEERAHHFDNPCKAMKYLAHRKEAITLYLGIGDRDATDQCQHLLKNKKLYMRTEWFDIDEPCVIGDMENAPQVFHYVHTYTASESFRFCNKRFLDDEFKIETVAYNYDAYSLKDANQKGQITHKSNSNGGEFVCMNKQQKKKPQAPNYWYHRNIMCMDYRIQFKCRCFFGCKQREKVYKEWKGWHVRVPMIEPPTGGAGSEDKIPTQTLFDECTWQPLVSHYAPTPDTHDAEIRPHMTWGDIDSPGAKQYRGHACGTGVYDAMYIQAVRISDGKTPMETGEVITKYTPAYGFLCINKNQEKGTKCSNYAARFCCRNKQPATWGEWTAWTKCPVICGEGKEFRSRKCLEDSDTETCIGAEAEIHKKQNRRCNILPCPVESNMEWSTWTEWEKCSVTCGRGTQYRKRECSSKSDDGKNKFAEDNCPSKIKENKKDPENNLFKETKECSDGLCAEPAWTDWGKYSKCSATCGQGTKTRTRTCHDMITGRDLDNDECGTEGLTNEHMDNCVVKTNCPVDGGVGQWIEWGPCSIHCGVGGTRQRHRDCNDPRPQFGGKDCPKFEKKQTEECNGEGKCPVNCVWSHWGKWSDCDKTCYPPTYDDKGVWKKGAIHRKGHIGSQYRKRHEAQKAENGGRECDITVAYQGQPCNTTKVCEAPCQWGEWGSWLDGGCEPCFDKDNGDEDDYKTATKERTRKIEITGTPDGDCIDSKGKDVKWSQRRKRKYEDEESVGCNPDGYLEPICQDIFAMWTEWGEWGDCIGECGKQGQRIRKRKCDIHPQGEQIDGYESKEKREKLRKEKCYAYIRNAKARGHTSTEEYDTCPSLCHHLGWAEWKEWGACSATCGVGYQIRARECNGAGKHEIDHVVADDVCGTHSHGKKAGKAKLRAKQRQDCDMGKCGSKDYGSIGCPTPDGTYGPC